MQLPDFIGVWLFKPGWCLQTWKHFENTAISRLRLQLESELFVRTYVAGANLAVVLVTALANRCWLLRLMFGDWLMLWLALLFSKEYSQGFLGDFRDPIRVHRIENRVLRIRENYHQVPKVRENRVPRIREIGSLQVHIGYLTFSLKNTLISCSIYLHYAIHFANSVANLAVLPRVRACFFVELRFFLRLAGSLFLGLF